MTVTFRTAARVVLLDDRDRVLLVRHTDPVESWDCWVAPGGGIDAGEEPADAARRELLEETGIRVPAVSDCVWRQRVRYRFAGADYDQVELFFAARVAGELSTEALQHTDVERDLLTDQRWWTRHEISASSDLFDPPELAQLLPDVIAGRLPAEPLVLST